MGSTSSSSESWNFGELQEYENLQIKQISVFDRLAQNKPLQILDGRHCFCVIKLNDRHNTEYKLEAGMDETTKLMGISYKLYAPDPKVRQQLITKVQIKQFLTFKQLGDRLQGWYKGGKYHPMGNNCYHVAERILEFLKFDKNAQLIKKKRRIIIQNGVGTAYGIIGNVGLGITAVVLGVVTKNWTPLIEMVEFSNKISISFRFAGIGAAKLVNKITKN